ncbi:MAG: dTMP kinase [Fimbriimonas ginsengisoli]|uniref:Thymidylate kinase n=1 Tax=Fimbriimonas ginsengisoli TaxID=1005039 RepID=A0A931PTV4_FIMGI|nr:dTMP kinase [Fimbriimonas ginsengisoli]MBI3722006.1 dTMP kinase [Fimbriimonas ginsengisoli]
MFVTFEGPEGAGKTTVLKAVARRLEADGQRVVMTREPGEGEIGAKIRDILLSGGDLSPAAELFLFLADRAQHVASVIKPALAAGAFVLCDRYSDSTLVYQGYGRGLDLETLRGLNQLATGGLTPDLTLLLDLDPELGLARLSLDKMDRMDRESIEFHRKVRDGFLREAKREPARWRVIDAAVPIAGVILACCQEVEAAAAIVGCLQARSLEAN